MGEERRREERRDSFEIVEVGFSDPEGGESSFPLLVRDRSEEGLGGVCVGAAVPPPGTLCRVEDESRGFVAMRLKWVQPLANHVFALGFEREAEGAVGPGEEGVP